jgi:uncharacterized membrane protein HdeD (DUF308 family)
LSILNYISAKSPGYLFQAGLFLYFNESKKGNSMFAKNIGWIIIGIAIMIAILRLTDVIDNTVTALLSTGNILILGGIAGAMAAKKKKQDEEESDQQS